MTCTNHVNTPYGFTDCQKPATARYEIGTVTQPKCPDHANLTEQRITSGFLRGRLEPLAA